MTYFSFGNMIKNQRPHFIDQINLIHPTIKFTAEYSKEEVIF